jgi:hypothetical protein
MGLSIFALQSAAMLYIACAVSGKIRFLVIYDDSRNAHPSSLTGAAITCGSQGKMDIEIPINFFDCFVGQNIRPGNLS